MGYGDIQYSMQPLSMSLYINQPTPPPSNWESKYDIKCSSLPFEGTERYISSTVDQTNITKYIRTEGGVYRVAAINPEHFQSFTVA